MQGKGSENGTDWSIPDGQEKKGNKSGLLYVVVAGKSITLKDKAEDVKQIIRRRKDMTIVENTDKKNYKCFCNLITKKHKPTK